MTIERFEKFINKTENCWEWIGCLDRHGYGVFSYKLKAERAHRISYLLYKNVEPKDLFVCHTCDNPKCVNPSHLFLGTNSDNVNDRISKNRRVGRFKRLNDTQVNQIKDMINSKLFSYRKIALMLDSDKETVRRISNNIY